MPKLPDQLPVSGPRSSLRVVNVEPTRTGLSEFGASLERIGQRKMDREDRFNYAQARSELLKKRNEVMEGIVDDDYQTYEARYNEGMQAAISKASDLIISKQDRELFEIEAQNQAELGAQRIRDRAKGKEIDIGRSTLSDMIASNREIALTADDEIGRMAAIRATQDAIEGALDRDYISAQDAQKLRQASVVDIATGFLDVLEPRERLEALDTETAGFIPADKKAAIRRATEREIKRLDNELKAEAERERTIYRAKLNDRVRDASAALMQGLDPGTTFTETEFVHAYPEDGAERFAEYQKTVQLGEDLGELATLSPEDATALLSERRPSPGEGFAADSDRYDALLKAAINLEKQKQADPAAYVMKHSGIEDPDAMLAEQERLGVLEPQVLTATQADQIVRQFSNTEEGGFIPSQILAGLSEEWGDKWPMVYKQLVTKHNLPPAALVIGSGVSAETGDLLSQVANTPTADLKKTLANTDVKDLNEELEGAMVPMRNSMFYQGADNLYGVIQEQAQRLGYVYMNQGMDATEAAEKAYDEIAGSKYDFGETFRVPVEYDADTVEEGANRLKSSLRMQDLGIHPDLIASDTFNEERVAEMLEAAYWVTNEDETGLVLYFNNAMVPDKDGNPIERSFVRMAAMAPPRFRF